MTLLKMKKCKSINKKTKGYGCGQLSDERIFGICPGCKAKWISETAVGEKWFDEWLKNHVKKTNKERAKADRERMAQMKIDVMSTDQYRSKYVQPLINKIARLIDYGQPCIATGNYQGKMAGGHFTSVGSNRTICLNLHNIFIQSFHSNSWSGGDNLKYRQSLITIFGQEYLDFVEGLRGHPPLHLTKEDMISIKEAAQIIVKELDKNKRIRTPQERIEMRNELNFHLGIYQEEYCKFKI